jgi:hypothetical protein
VALTRVFGRVHAKLLYAQAFRPPGFENVAVGQDIRAERTRVMEAELGWQVAGPLYLGANAFDITIDDPIVYWSQGTGAEGYLNGPRMGSRGLEAEARWVSRWARLGASWSWYDASKNRVPDYAVPGRPRLAQGFPAHKITATAVLTPTPKLTLGATAVLSSSRYGYLSDGSGTGWMGDVGRMALVDVTATLHGLGAPNIDLGLSIHDLLGNAPSYAHPYPGHAPLPGPSREIVLTLSYEP